VSGAYYLYECATFICNFIVDRTNIEEKRFELQNSHDTNESFENAHNINDTLADNHFLDMLSRETCIYIYTAVTVGTIVVTLVRSITFFKVCMRASVHLHDTMFRSIIRATMYFFDTNPSGKY